MREDRYIDRQRGKPPSQQIDFVYFGFLRHDYALAKKEFLMYQRNAENLRTWLGNKR